MGGLINHGLHHGFIKNLKKSNIHVNPQPSATEPRHNEVVTIDDNTSPTNTDDDDETDDEAFVANVNNTSMANVNRLANTQSTHSQLISSPKSSNNQPALTHSQSVSSPQTSKTQTIARLQSTSRIPTASSPALTRAMQIEKLVGPFQGKSLSHDELSNLACKDQKCVFCNVPLNFDAIKDHVISTHPKIVKKYNLSFL